MPSSNKSEAETSSLVYLTKASDDLLPRDQWGLSHTLALVPYDDNGTVALTTLSKPIGSPDSTNKPDETELTDLRELSRTFLASIDLGGLTVGMSLKDAVDVIGTRISTATEERTNQKCEPTIVLQSAEEYQNQYPFTDAMGHFDSKRIAAADQSNKSQNEKDEDAQYFRKNWKKPTPLSMRFAPREADNGIGFDNLDNWVCVPSTSKQSSNGPRKSRKGTLEQYATPDDTSSKAIDFASFNSRTERSSPPRSWTPQTQPSVSGQGSPSIRSRSTTGWSSTAGTSATASVSTGNTMSMTPSATQPPRSEASMGRLLLDEAKKCLRC